ncbi:MAG TPA: DUF3276 family protein [Paludibacter sp.]|nr:MAG: hypothetical protein BWY08_02315 [Bacteroidetes bacterium ADurb.Bin174]HQB27980.1 DUF3276 family protein [Paludibacter sp.]
MEEEKRKIALEKRDDGIVYSKSIKAGKRIYYLDVKKSRNDDLFLSITESKKKVYGTDQDMQVRYEKHKIFLYKEDFDKFLEGLNDVIGFIENLQENTETSSSPKKEEPKVTEDSKDSEVAELQPSAEKEETKSADTEAEEEEEAEEKKGFFDKFKF